MDSPRKDLLRPGLRAQIMRWFTQLTQAIAHIHNHKIIHRDLKTSNIFLTTVRFGLLDVPTQRGLSSTNFGASSE